MTSATDAAAFRKACVAGEAAAVRRGLDAGCDPSAANAKGMTPLMLAVWQHDAVDVVEMLLDAGADTSPRQESSNWSAATFAAVNGKLESLRLLLARGASVDGDWKALHFAVQYRSRETVPVLLDAGLDIDARDDEARTALMRAARNSDAALVALLLERGAQAAAQDSDGWTALHFAATKANASNVVALRAAGADANAAARDGATPRDVAADAGRAKISAALA